MKFNEFNTLINNAGKKVAQDIENPQSMLSDIREIFTNLDEEEIIPFSAAYLIWTFSDMCQRRFKFNFMSVFQSDFDKVFEYCESDIEAAKHLIQLSQPLNIWLQLSRKKSDYLVPSDFLYEKLKKKNMNESNCDKKIDKNKFITSLTSDEVEWLSYYFRRKYDGVITDIRAYISSGITCIEFRINGTWFIENSFVEQIPPSILNKLIRCIK